MYSTEFEKALKQIEKVEGGFVDNKKDPGGATNHGITIGTYSNYLGRPATVSELKAIPLNHRKEIYHEYWQSVRGDDITDKRVSYVLFDQMVNRGGAAKKQLQTQLNLTADGEIGPETLTAINAKSFEESSNMISEYGEGCIDAYDQVIRNRPTSEAFRDGWYKRTNNAMKHVGLAPTSAQLKTRTKTSGTDKPLSQSTYVGKVKDLEVLNNAQVIQNGDFRFNDIVFNIPPESISIINDEYEDSIHLMREETPVNKQSGRKHIRIVVNFPIDISNGWDEITRMVLQIKKTPIATIENEKIRKELFGDVYDFTNMGVVVDNLSGYVEEDYPTLMRCTLQMSWLNHAPYVEEIKYIEYKNGKKVSQKRPSEEFVRFYESNTKNSKNQFINDPSGLSNKESLTILYKEYQRFAGTTTASDPKKGSQLDSRPKIMTHDNFIEFKRLESAGWYIAEENQDKWDDLIDGVFYRWRKFEIPFSDLEGSGALILQNVSFSLNTNPTYINMEHYAIPTVQFLGGSVSDLRAICFAAPEYISGSDKTPVGTSEKLGELQTILKKISQDRLTYSKYAKENHLLISHPIAKLLKYRAYQVGDKKHKYFDESDIARTFKVDDFLPVIVSSSLSSTINGLPFASKFQIDFKETRFARRDNPIKYGGTSGSRNGFKIQQNIVKTLFINKSIAYDPESRSFEIPLVTTDRGTPEFLYAEKLATALTNLARLDNTVVDMDTAYKSKYFLQKPRAEVTNTIPSFSYGSVFSGEWVSQFTFAYYVAFNNSRFSDEEWLKPYIELFNDYSSEDNIVGDKDLFPDLYLPEKEINPTFYFADNSTRVSNYRRTIMQNMPSVYADTANNIKQRLLNPEFNKKIKDGDQLLPAYSSVYAPAKNYSTYQDSRNTGTARIHDINDQNYRIMSTQQAVADISPPMHSLSQAYPAFQIQLFTEKYSFFQKFSSSDIKSEELFDKNQKDLLDIFDLSSIIDIRIIKDENEAADAMIIRVLSTHKNLMTSQSKDPSYNPDTFSITSLITNMAAGINNVGATYNQNLEDVGLKEGIKIRAMLGNSNDSRDLGVEFNGRIAAINGKDIVEIYCLGDGHELIQNTMGYDSTSTKEFSANSDTTNLIAKVLASADELKSFGNTKFEVIKGIGFNLPLLMGGRSALDNIYAPSIHPAGNDLKEFGTGVFDSALSTMTTIGGIAIPLAVLSGGITIPGIILTGLIGGLASGALALVTQSYKMIMRKVFPAPFVIFQQTIWDVLQELTLRHPGYIAAVVPFDNRSSIYFGEPDGIFFYRGAQSALEKAIKIKAGKETQVLSNNATLREIFDERSGFADLKLIGNIGDPTSPFSKVDAKERIANRSEQLKKAFNNTDIEMLALMGMQKSFRSYHLVTSEHDIISNDIETSSVGVANSVQVYHPDDSSDVEYDGTQYIKDYELTDKMKADDDIHSNLINNKIYTFHNAHNNYPELELPQRYAKAILCKELGNIYRGKIDILGRKGIKPHDIVILRDTHNRINGPVKVGRVVQTVSPTTGWVTSIYPKFIAIPDTSSGLFQMKAMLKAARFWLGDEVELFYSSMEKFIPSELPQSLKKNEEEGKIISGLFGNGQYANEKNTDMGGFSKELMRTVGEQVVSGETTQSAVTVGGQVLGVNKVLPAFAGAPAAGTVSDLGTKKVLNSVAERSLYGAKGQLLDLKNVFSTNANATSAAIKSRNISKAAVTGASGFFSVAAKTAVTGARLGGGVFGGLLFGFGLDYAIESVSDGLISWMKYRQPISIFPLSKDGKPWMAALNGFKENTPLEHLELQATRAGDKLAMTSFLMQKILGDWGGEQIGSGNSEEIQIANIVDGDTIDGDDGIPSSLFNLIAGDGERYRLVGVDTGEKTAPDGSNEKFMAGEAKKYLEKRIAENGGTVSVQRYGKDRYNRTLANIYVAGSNLSQELVNKNLAFFYKGQPKQATEQDWANLRAKYEGR
jgi:lysozyme family protein/endonuclease YncB( thermonuclease family)